MKCKGTNRVKLNAKRGRRSKYWRIRYYELEWEWFPRIKYRYAYLATQSFNFNKNRIKDTGI
jgi:hypothetical protein